MIILPGQNGTDLCDKGLAPSRRDILRAGGAGMLGLSLGSLTAIPQELLHCDEAPWTSSFCSQ